MSLRYSFFCRVRRAVMFAPILIEVENAGPMTGLGNNTYLVEDDEAGAGSDRLALLIDAGTGGDAHLAGMARRLAERQARLTDVIVTHIHPDHASGAPAIRTAFPGVRFAKYPWPEQDRQYAVDWRPLADDEEIRIGGTPLTVLHTPGHSPDHVALWHQDSRTAFTGDLVTQGGTVMIGWSHGGDLLQYLSSLKRILSLNPNRLLPGHGPVVTDPATLLTATIEHRLQRERQVYASLTRGLETVPAITESIYDGLDPAVVPAARDTVRAHLEKLRRERRAFDEDGRWTPD
jgi:glyoxylase-like metal-dependent hydrolase (beta-lactamase superfamily II)